MEQKIVLGFITHINSVKLLKIDGYTFQKILILVFLIGFDFNCFKKNIRIVLLKTKLKMFMFLCK